MPGRPEFSIPGTKGSNDKVAVQESPQTVFKDRNSSATISADGSESMTFYPPDGKRWKILGMLLDAPGIGTATTGTQRYVIQNSGQFYSIQADSSTNEKVKFESNEWQVASLTYPSTPEATLMAMRKCMATPSKPLTVQYQNNTDVEQTGTRRQQFLFEEVDL